MLVAANAHVESTSAAGVMSASVQLVHAIHSKQHLGLMRHQSLTLYCG